MTDTKYQIELLKAMNKIILAADDEGIVEPWLMGGIPDASSEDDYREIAEDPDDLKEITALFCRLVSKKNFSVYLGKVDGKHTAIGREDYGTV